MTNSVDPDQLASSEANWSGSTLFAKTGHVVFSKRRVMRVLQKVLSLGSDYFSAITAFVSFQKFPGTFKVLCLLLLSEQMRYPPSTNLFQVQTLFQNCLQAAFWYASTTSYIFDRQSRILFDHNLYSRDVSLGNRGFRPSRTGIIFNRKLPSFKSFNPPKNCAHWNGLRSIYTTQFIKYLLWIYITVSLMRHFI